LLDSIYGQVMRVRRRRYERQPQRQRRLSRPVISVGNLSMGGTGKTPVVVAIAEWLLANGQRPSILSRGYARADNADGVVVVSDGHSILAGVDRSGDEPLMMARQVPGATVCVSPERYLGGALAERLGCTVHLLDDGFQHLELARDLDILVTTLGEIPNGRVIPAGRLREPKDAAARAHVLVVSDATAGAAAAEAWGLGISQSCGTTRTIGVPIGLWEKGVWEKNVPFRDHTLYAVAPVLAVAGIANPERFVQSLKDAGWPVADVMTFPDHHRYTATDIAAIKSRMESSRAELVMTTDKDAVRLEGPIAAASSIASDGTTTVPFLVYRAPLRLQFDPETALFESIKAVLV
jgi:tetraacyldisaccharide 4'-kinase